MAEKLQILLADDDEDEFWLLEDQLTGNGYDPYITRVEEQSAFRQALESREWSALLVDFRMPSLTAESCLRIYREDKLDIPFIIFSGTIGEEAAVELMRAGAWDFVSKDRRSRLIPVLKRALRETRIKREHKETRRTLHDSQRMLSAIAELAQDAILMVDAHGRIGYWNAAAQRTLGFARSEAMGLEVVPHLMPQRHHAGFARFLRRFARSGEGRIVGKTFEFNALHKQGHEIPVEVSTSALPMGKEWWLLAILRDISERKTMEAELQHMALHDTLTGLYNRRILEQRLESEVERCTRYGETLSLFFIDIDHFKRINDEHGHHVGDDLLRQLTSKLRVNIRAVDLLARYGGEEFVALIPESSGPEVVSMAERLCRKVAEYPFRPGNDLTLQITISIGVSWYPEHGTDADSLLDAADHAMYHAKQNGRNRVCVAESCAPSDDRK